MVTQQEQPKAVLQHLNARKGDIFLNGLFLSITLKLFSLSSPLKHYKLLFLFNFL